MSLEIRPGYRYTKAQMRAGMTDELATRFKNAGYILRLDDQGFYSLVHMSQGFGGQVVESKGPGQLEVDRALGGQAGFTPPAPIVKRTPQQRLDSLVQKMWPEVKDLGHIPGVQDKDILPIVLNAKGRADELAKKNKRLTGEDVRTVAASLLTKAEKEHEEKLSKQITRHED